MRGARAQLEGQLCDQAERAVAAVEQFTEIVAGDVLDNVAAGFDLPAVGKKSAQAKHEAARLAVSKALCAAHASGHDAAHARAPVVRRVEWQPLTGATRC